MQTQNPENIRFYCPNPVCPYHALDGKHHQRFERLKLFWKIGSFLRKVDGSKVNRFKCKHCRTTFASSVVSPDYRNKRRGLSRKVFFMHVDGLSNRQIARNLKVDEKLIRTRLKYLAQQSFLNHSKRTRRLKIKEVIAYDGVENFAKSQYEPNNINQAIGSTSHFIYDFNFSPLNRKGRMSNYQKLNKEKLEKSLGRFPQDAIRTSTELLFHRLISRFESKTERLCIASDKHFQYRRVVETDLRKQGIFIDHVTVSSKASRTYRHILFSVNLTDFLLRQYSKAFMRETISFSKTHAAMIQKYVVFMVWKNYMRPQFTKSQKINQKANTQSPAMSLGLETRILRFKDFFGTRKLPSQVPVNAEWSNYFNSVVPNLREISA